MHSKKKKNWGWARVDYIVTIVTWPAVPVMFCTALHPQIKCRRCSRSSVLCLCWYECHKTACTACWQVDEQQQLHSFSRLNPFILAVQLMSASSYKSHTWSLRCSGVLNWQLHMWTTLIYRNKRSISRRKWISGTSVRQKRVIDTYIHAYIYTYVHSHKYSAHMVRCHDQCGACSSLLPNSSIRRKWHS